MNRKILKQIFFLLYLALEVFFCSGQSPSYDYTAPVESAGASPSGKAVAAAPSKLALAAYALSNTTLLDALEKSASMAEFYRLCSTAENKNAQKANPLAMTLPSLLCDAVLALQRRYTQIDANTIDARFMDGSFLSHQELGKEIEKPQTYDKLLGGAFFVENTTIDVVSFFFEAKTSQFSVHRSAFDIFSLEAFPSAVLADFSGPLWGHILASDELKTALQTSLNSAVTNNPQQSTIDSFNKDLLAWVLKEAHSQAQRKFTASLSRTIISMPVTLLLFGLYQGYSEAAFRNTNFETVSSISLGAALASSAVTAGFVVDTFVNLRQLLRTSF